MEKVENPVLTRLDFEGRNQKVSLQGWLAPLDFTAAPVTLQIARRKALSQHFRKWRNLSCVYVFFIRFILASPHLGKCFSDVATLMIMTCTPNKGVLVVKLTLYRLDSLPHLQAQWMCSMHTYDGCTNADTTRSLGRRFFETQVLYESVDDGGFEWPHLLAMLIFSGSLKNDLRRRKVRPLPTSWL